jgi:hypothetical protein
MIRLKVTVMAIVGRFPVNLCNQYNFFLMTWTSRKGTMLFNWISMMNWMDNLRLLMSLKNPCNLSLVWHCCNLKLAWFLAKVWTASILAIPFHLFPIYYTLQRLLVTNLISFQAWEHSV